MKTLPRPARISLFLFIIVFLILAVAPVMFQSEVSGIILSALNRNLATRIEVGRMKLSFIRKFPRASVELRNVVVHSSPGINKNDFKTGADTLLYSRTAFVIFRPADIFTGNYRIGSVIAKSGFVNLIEDRAGNENYKVSSGKGGGNVSIDLPKIVLTDMKAGYRTLSGGFSIDGLIRDGVLRTHISGENIDFSADTKMIVDSFVISGVKISNPLDAALSMSLRSTPEGIFFNHSLLDVEGYKFRLEGSISKDDVYNLNINSGDMNLSGINRLLPEKINKALQGYDPDGTMVAGCTVKGPFTKKQSPHVEMDFILSNGRIGYRNSKAFVKDISFRGRLSNGKANSVPSSSIALNDLRISLGSATYTGTAAMSNFRDPVTTLEIAGSMIPSELVDFFDLSKVNRASGKADIDLKLSINSSPGKWTSAGIAGIKSSGTIDFENFTLGFEKNDLLIGNVNGNITITDAFRANGLSLDYKGQHISVDGDFRNVTGWIAGRENLVASAEISTDRFIPEAFIRPATANPSAPEKTSMFPDDLVLDLKVSISNLEYKTFTSSNIKGNLAYKPRQISFNSLNMSTLKGTISGNGFISQNKNGTFISRGDFAIAGIDVKNAFTSFNNFGQAFIVAENLSGSLSGSVSVLLPFDRHFNPLTKDVAAEGKYVLLNGALVDFEPVKQLSNFIELSELENINFKKLENNFYIRNNTFFMPTMDVNSSAADISVNGQHGFDNNYEYHVKVLLSQILSRKRKPPRKTVTEFGVIEDDGLGRTRLLLKVTGNGDVVKVGYDIREMAKGVQENIRAEKENLKTILNEEYGWYDEAPETKKAVDAKKKRFSITWEETDSVPARPE